MNLKQVWFLSGPTASGKTAVGVELAALIGAEIISLDSMALYRGMDIGTAKPSPAERGRVPHHLLDCIEPHEEYSVARYVEAAERTVNDIESRGRTALFVGGTPLYLKSLLRGIFPGPAADWPLRERLAAIEDTEGAGALHARLALVDAASAARLHREDTRRLIRALEVFEKTGTPISVLQRQFDKPTPREDCRVYVLKRPRQELNRRIDERVEAMFNAGLLDEARRLVAAGRPPSRTASQAVGYREAFEHLAGNVPLADAISLVKARTRQLAKRQMTWFRGLSECRFIQVSGDAEPSAIARRILNESPASEDLHS